MSTSHPHVGPTAPDVRRGLDAAPKDPSMTPDHAPPPTATPTPRPGSGPRRRSRRDRVTCLVWLERVGGGRSSGVARAVDLSPRGVGVVIPHAIDLDEEVVVELLVPPTRLRLRTTGRVVHAQQVDDAQFRLGVRFEHPPVLVDERRDP